MPTSTVEIVRLPAHDPIPSGPAKQVIVLHRLDEDAPSETIITISLTGKQPQTTRPMRDDGVPMDIDEAIDAARRVAESESLNRIFVLDRTQGERERDILAHGGDHSVHMDALVDTDLGEGKRGPDMRDRTP